MEIELIEWLDSCGVDASWVAVQDMDAPKAVLCRSVGFVLYEGNDALRIAPHYAPETSCSFEQATGCMVIPQCAIVRRMVLVSED